MRIAGLGTRPWGRPVDGGEVRSSLELASIREHNAGDFTAIVEAGVPVDRAQAVFAAHGQRLALDPPPGGTIGGLFATADAGPLRHRYGAARDLIIGIEVELADGSIAKAGGKVIKNVAGYDLAKLFTGSFGTLGLIRAVAVRLHPLPTGTATAVLDAQDPAELGRLARELGHRPLEAEALDVRWAAGDGSLLVRLAGATAREEASALSDVVVEDDDALWAEQRARQRGQLVLRVSALPTELPEVLRVCDDVVGRAAQGVFYCQLAPDADVEAVRAQLPGHAVLLDAPTALRGQLDPWDVPEGPALTLQRRVKHRFDPEGKWNPGLFVGGI